MFVPFPCSTTQCNLHRGYTRLWRTSLHGTDLGHYSTRFQWASLHIDELLMMEHSSDIMKYLDSLPEGLRQAYDRIYTHIKSKRGSAGIIADRVFLSIMGSWRPLAPEELVVIVSHDVHSRFGLPIGMTIQGILHACQNLVVLTKPARRDSWTTENSRRQVCRFSHLSVQEYIEGHIWSRAQAHEFLAQICLQSLLNPLSNAIGEASGILPSPDTQSLATTQSPYSVWKKRQYVDGWGFHLATWAATWADVRKFKPSPLPNLVLKFLGSPHNSGPFYREWLESIKTRTHYRCGLHTRHTILSVCTPASEALGGALLFNATDAVAHWIETGEVAPNDTYLGYPILSFCARYGNLELCRELISRGAAINAPGFPALESGCQASARISVPLLLLDNGANVNSQTAEGTSALESSIKAERTDLVKLLLERGADINAGNGLDKSIIRAAVLAGHDEIAELILGKVSMFEPQQGDDGPILELVIRHGNFDMMALLLAKGADPNGRSVYSQSPLFAALRNKKEDLAVLLLHHGANANLCSKVHGTPLHVAAEKSSPDMVAHLLAAGASPQLVAGRYGTCINAVFCNHRRGMARQMAKTRLLLAAGATFNEADYTTVRSPYNNLVGLKAFISKIGSDKRV